MENSINTMNVTAEGGMPELIVGGKKTVPLWFALSDMSASNANTEYAQKNITLFKNCGIDVVCVDCNLQSGWKEGRPYDATEIFEELAGVIKANSNACVVIRLHVNAPYWWMRKNPDELIGYFGVEPTDNGGHLDRLIMSDVLPEYSYEIRVSFASEKYYRECGEVITKLCRQIKRSEYGERLLGVQVAYGTCGEWHPFGKYHQPNHAGGEADYGKAMLGVFRRYLREKYKTENNLQAAYHTDETFENVRLATPDETIYTQSNYRFIEGQARAIDTLVCFQRSTTSAISAFCKAVKDADKNILAGSFYGYYFGAGGVMGAMYEQDRLFVDENVDFIAATSPYTKNRFCGYFCNFRHTAESMRLNGKLFLNEMDQGYAAHASYRDEGDGSGVYSCESEEEYAAVLKRNMMENILRGNGAWYYDHHIKTDRTDVKVGYWEKTERLATVAEIQRACEKIQRKPFVKTTDVLLVFDAEKGYYLSDSFFYNSYNSFEFFDAVMKSGAGVDTVFLSDIQKVDLARYKCIMFVECINMSSETYAFVKDAVGSCGRTIVFVGECGYILDGVPSKANIEEIVKTGEYLTTPVCDRKYYHDLFKRAGAHIYTDGGEVVVADNEMVMVHCKDIPKTVLHLSCGDIEIENGNCNTVVYNIKTGEKLL